MNYEFSFIFERTIDDAHPLSRVNDVIRQNFSDFCSFVLSRFRYPDSVLATPQ